MVGRGNRQDRVLSKPFLVDQGSVFTGNHQLARLNVRGAHLCNSHVRLCSSGSATMETSVGKLPRHLQSSAATPTPTPERFFGERRC